MADYPSILHKSADAISYALTSIAGADLPSCTIYKDDASSDLTPPAVVIECNAAVLSEESGTCSPENFMVEVSIKAVSQADDSTRAAHGLLSGIIEAVFFRTAGDVVTECNAASVSAFTAKKWIPLGITSSKDEDRRETTHTGRLLCTSRAP